MRSVSKILMMLVLAQAFLVGCEKEPLEVEPAVKLSEYFTQPAETNAPIRFSVDSTIYQPAIGGTSSTQSSSFWIVQNREIAPDSISQVLTVTILDQDMKFRNRLFWRQELVNDGQGLTSAIDGITYLSLTKPLALGSTWDALVYTDKNLQLNVASEPIEIHKDWSARVDSLGVYQMPSGKTIDAVWVTHANAENRIELRSVREIYGRGLGLLERHVSILNSQQLEDKPWEQKAEKGFTLSLRRIE